ncbi:Lar family restriction alleviation protein [Cupriavidus basilensis]|uniref:Lar family restriction alleviation protein n=1 Tax=Cupriavidus basilensis TaxID=68895 RepID=UPI003D35049E
MTESAERLAPCPCCGGTASFDHDDDGWNWIVCGSCGLSTDCMASLMDDCRPTLREKWNRRAPAAGHCAAGDACVCGGDVPRVRAGCGNWIVAAPEMAGTVRVGVLGAAAPARPLPEGWWLVPVHPTEDMLVFGQEAWATKKRERNAVEDCEEAASVYRAMLAAAPAAPRGAKI